MRTDLSFDVMEKILPDVCEIIEDPEFEKLKQDIRQKKTKGSAELIKRVLPVFITAHKDATLNLIAEISGKDRDTVDAQDIKETLADANNGMLDAMIDFFAWALRLVLKV